MNLKTIITEVLPTLSQDEMKTLGNAIQNEFSIRLTREVNTMNIGDRYLFTHNNIRKEGTIVKLNKTSVSVKVSDTETWKVTPNLLTKVEQI